MSHFSKEEKLSIFKEFGGLLKEHSGTRLADGDVRARSKGAVETFKRQCVFIGTTERDDWMPETGRRWWPVKVGKINLDGLARIRPMLMAEALLLGAAVAVCATPSIVAAPGLFSTTTGRPSTCASLSP
mgnify:CR=1 FL=1